MIKFRKYAALIAAVMITAVSFTGCSSEPDNRSGTEISIETSIENLSEASDSIPDYSDKNNWAYYEDSASEKTADVFFICPTVYFGDDTSFNMSMSDEKTKKNFLGAINMEKGIYDEDARFFAPYYRQAGLNAYFTEKSEEYLAYGHNDVKAAFEHYLKNCNNDRPVILAGFSQGADLSIRLVKDYFGNEKNNSLLVACYAVGWGIAEEETAEYPHLKIAEDESDIGVTILFNSEDESVTDSIMIPKGMKTFAVNPLNWKNDGTPADKSLNLGACFTDYSGNIVKEIPNLTGAYIDETRGALKVTDIDPKDYPPDLDAFGEGVYHMYDYQFFYRNLQQNVRTRIQSYVTYNSKN